MLKGAKCRAFLLALQATMRDLLVEQGKLHARGLMGEPCRMLRVLHALRRLALCKAGYGCDCLPFCWVEHAS